MKTAMQELIDDLKELKKDSKERNQDSSFDIGMTFAIARAELRLEIEKMQIINAHLEGWSDAYDYLKSDSNDQARQAEDYYNQTYNN
jgi:hypothetical protein